MKKLLFFATVVLFVSTTLHAQKEILTQFKLERNRINCAAMVGDKMVYGASFSDFGRLVLDSTPYRSSERRNYVLITDIENNFIDSAIIPYYEAQHMPLHQIVSLTDTSFMAIHFAVSYSDSIIRIVFAEFYLNAIKQPQVRVFNMNLPAGFRPFPSFRGNATNLAPISNLSQEKGFITGNCPMQQSRLNSYNTYSSSTRPTYIYIYRYSRESVSLIDTVYNLRDYQDLDRNSDFVNYVSSFLFEENGSTFRLSSQISGETFVLDSNMILTEQLKPISMDERLEKTTYRFDQSRFNTITSSTHSNGYTLGGMFTNVHTWQYSMPRWWILKESYLIRLINYDWQNRLVDFKDYAPPHTDDTAFHYFYHVDTPDLEWFPIGQTKLQTAIYHTMCRTNDGNIYFLYNDLDRDDLHGSVVKFNAKGDIESYINIEDVYFSMAGDFGFDVEWFGIYATPDGGCVITGSHFWRHQWGDPFVLKISPNDFPTAIRKPPLVNKSKLMAYPNPAISHLSFKGLNATDSYVLQIYGSDGKLILKQRLENGVDNIRLSDMPSGLYFYHITNEQNGYTESGKFLKN